MPTTPMRGATMFTGIRAPEVACPEIQWRWCAEIDPFCCALIKHYAPETPNLGDVNAEDFIDRARTIGPIDVIVFGSPCQDFSVAGKRGGINAARGNLALRSLEIVDALRPTWFLFENVPGLLSSWSGDAPDAGRVDWDSGRERVQDLIEGSDFAAWLQVVADIGFVGAWANPDAQWFGLAQRRERLFFVGHSGDWRGPAAVLAEFSCLSGYPAPSRETRQGITHELAPSLTGSGRGVERPGESRGQDPVVAVGHYPEEWGPADNRRLTCSCGNPDPGHLNSGLAFGGNNTSGPVDIATACNAKGGSGRMDFESETFVASGRGYWAEADESATLGTEARALYESTLVAHALRADGFDASEDGTGRGTPLVAFICEQNNMASTPSLPSLRAHSTPNYGVFLPATPPMIGEFTCGECGSKSHVRGKWNPVMEESRVGVRRLTPAECETLQGFNRGYTLINYRGKPAADGPRYKSIGNSMAAPVVRYLLTRIMFVHNVLNTEAQS